MFEITCNYFDKFHLFANKYVNDLNFREVYIILTKGKYLEDQHIIKNQKYFR